jgi:calcineurin-like phosphoesterase family protein
MSKYYISDTHFGHENIINFTGRPYKSAEHMDEDMIKRWNNKVGNGDLVYHLGDFAWKNIKYYRGRLNGQIILIKGNHDRRLTKQQEEKLFVKVCNYDKVSDGENTVILFHYPIWSWDGLHKGYTHFHGHIHERIVDVTKMENTSYTKGKGVRINICVERMEYEPKTYEEIINMPKT